MMELGIPRYLWVYNSLKNQIETEDYKVGDFLPAEPELQKAFHVSRTTVRKAVEMLAQQGFVYIRQGKGTQVMDFKATQKLGFVTSFSETLREKGATVTQADVRIDFVSAPRRIALDLQIDPNERVVKIERVTMANGTPIAPDDQLPRTVDRPRDREAARGLSGLYSFLESEYNLVIEAATDYISARDVTDAEAERLQIPPHSPLLVVRRITHSGGRPVEVAILLIVADKYEYCVHTRTGRPGHRARAAGRGAAGNAARGRSEESSRMTLTARDVAQLIDISAVQAPHGAAEIRGLVETAKEYRFIAVHVLPCWVGFLKDLLDGSPDILIGAPVGFPGGRTAPRSRWPRRSASSATACRKWT